LASVQLIVGLGNPGPRYDRTRHNAGFWFLDALAAQYRCDLKSESRFHGAVGRCTIAGQDCRLLRPDTFMNHSGRSIAAVARFYRIPPEAILVAHDELDLDPGVVRLKRGGGHGGHNGLRDTIAQLGSKDFLRLRIGIGHPGHKDQVVDYVLQKPSPDDRIAIERAIDRALDVVPEVISGDLERAMNRLHAA